MVSLPSLSSLVQCLWVRTEPTRVKHLLESLIRLTPGGAAESGFVGKRLAVVRRRAETERRRVGRRVDQVAVGVHLESML